ncbi:TPA: hypothetical protein ACMD15_003408 [Vibrio cholerae]
MSIGNGGTWGIVIQVCSFIGSIFSQNNLQTIALLCGIASAIFTALYFRSAKRKADAEHELLRLKIKQQKMRVNNVES